MDWAFVNVAILSIVEIYGDFSLRFYAQTDKVYWLANGIVGYIGVVYFLIQSLRHGNVLYVNGLWDGMSGIIESAAAYLILGDRLKRPAQYVGLILTIVGILMLKH
jgi:multidrug transporter EmrE-like cation transporter